MAREDGFTLIETLVATTIGASLIVLLAVFVNCFVFSAASLDARLQAQMAADHLIERLISDASSAWAVYVPQNDVFGNGNQDGHEVDYFSEDGAHRTYSWAYTYDATSRHLLRYSFARGQEAQKDQDLGAFDSFSATAVTASQLGTIDPLFANSTIPSVTYGYDAAPGATGGNGMVRINLSASGVERSEMLASSTAPTTFTVIVTYTPSPAPTPEPIATPPPWTNASPTPP